MKRHLTISAHNAVVGLSAWLVVADALVGLAHLTNWWGLKVLVFVCITMLPGLTLMRVIRITLKNPPAELLYSFGLGVLVLMLSGLAANQLLHPFVAKPLSLGGILATWNAVVMGLIVLASRNRSPVGISHRPFAGFSKFSWAVVVISTLLPCMAAMGAFRLNNGGDAIFAVSTVCLIATLAICVLVFRNRVPDQVLAWFIFATGLAILLMTSLRGWDIVGHDIEREFRVYTLTHNYSHWNIGLYRDPYNACLSITILPEVFAKLIGLSGLVVFKLVLQVVFAACPAAIYILLRQYVSKLAALVGGMLFLCYPTFINDSAMLTRQGVAYLFFALALLIISNKKQERRYKLLFLLCATGAILSHYSTAYMFVALFGAAVACKLFLQRLHMFHYPVERRTQRSTVLSMPFVVLLFLMTFIWYTQLTATSGGVFTTLRASMSNISRLFSADNKSSDTSSALLFAGGQSQANLYESYITRTVSHHDDSNINDAVRYLPVLTNDELPLTPLGKRAQSVGIRSTMIASLRQNFAKILQLLAVFGVGYVAWRLFKGRRDAIEPDFVCLNMAGLVLLGLMVLLPVLSINYGLLRAFQQALIFMLLPIMLLLVRVGRSMPAQARVVLSVAGTVSLLFLFTGLFAQLLGGTSPSLSMDNSGLYHGLYYAPAADRQSFAWLAGHLHKDSDARAANFNRALMNDPEYPFSHVGVLPSQITPRSTVYLDAAQVRKRKFYAYYQGSPIIMTFPLDYYEQYENEIYSTTSTRVYQ